jgi:hypothetical protein
MHFAEKESTGVLKIDFRMVEHRRAANSDLLTFDMGASALAERNFRI